MPHGLLTRIFLVDTGLALSRKQLPTSRTVSTTISTCPAYAQLILRSDVEHTFCIVGTYPHLADRMVDPIRLW